MFGKSNDEMKTKAAEATVREYDGLVAQITSELKELEQKIGDGGD